MPSTSPWTILSVSIWNHQGWGWMVKEKFSNFFIFLLHLNHIQSSGCFFFSINQTKTRINIRRICLSSCLVKESCWALFSLNVHSYQLGNLNDISDVARLIQFSPICSLRLPLPLSINRFGAGDICGEFSRGAERNIQDIRSTSACCCATLRVN